MATAPTSTPPPKAITKCRNSSSSQAGPIRSTRAIQAPAGMQAPARAVQSNSSRSRSNSEVKGVNLGPSRASLCPPHPHAAPATCHQLMAMLRGVASAVFGRLSVSTPSFTLASIRLLSIRLESWNERVKWPTSYSVYTGSREP